MPLPVIGAGFVVCAAAPQLSFHSKPAVFAPASVTLTLAFCQPLGTLVVVVSVASVANETPSGQVLGVEKMLAKGSADAAAGAASSDPRTSSRTNVRNRGLTPRLSAAPLRPAVRTLRRRRQPLDRSPSRLRGRSPPRRRPE